MFCIADSQFLAWTGKNCDGKNRGGGKGRGARGNRARKLWPANVRTVFMYTELRYSWLSFQKGRLSTRADKEVLDSQLSRTVCSFPFWHLKEFII
ncbi:hypothetical protein CEXT_138301 [Caerostris extrusa]|uniref:Uncharacterized protein n=1 Tax=Caerostris extrusa TaxID=172846 RepID=A0AAV4VR28_CAEEX|nr:hypothetical protein CEXT_138301 [Caerostris extrusa]